jgi:predicted O-methyltransferase YrrM
MINFYNHNLKNLDIEKENFVINEIKSFPTLSDSTSNKDCIFLSKLIFRYRPKNILEIGTWVGKSTYTMALTASLSSKDYSIDTIDINRQVDFSKFQKFKNNIKFYHGHSSNILSKINKKYDLIFIDGNVDQQTAIHIHKMTTFNSIIVFHDYYPLGDKGLYNMIELAKHQNYKFIVPQTKLFSDLYNSINTKTGEYNVSDFKYNDYYFNGTCGIAFLNSNILNNEILCSKMLKERNYIIMRYILFFAKILIFSIEKILKIKMRKIFYLNYFKNIIYFDFINCKIISCGLDCKNNIYFKSFTSFFFKKESFFFYKIYKYFFNK